MTVRVVAELMAQGALQPRRERSLGTGVGIGAATPDLLAPCVRLLELLQEPPAIPVLAPEVGPSGPIPLMSSSPVRISCCARRCAGEAVVRHCGWMPASLITLLHFSSSDC